MTNHDQKKSQPKPIQPDPEKLMTIKSIMTTVRMAIHTKEGVNWTEQKDALDWMLYQGELLWEELFDQPSIIHN